MYRDGVVAEIDAATFRVKVRFPDRGDVLSPWLRVLQRNAHANKDESLPDEGELVACLLDENETSGCVLGGFYVTDNLPASPSTDVRRVTFADGSKIEYDRENNKLTIDLDGGTADLVASLLTIIGNVHIDGNLQVGEGAQKVPGADKVNARFDAIEAYLAQLDVWLPTHAHGGVTTGPGVSGPAPGAPTPAPSGSPTEMNNTTTD